MFDACCHQKESSVDVHQEGRRFKVDTQIHLEDHGVREESRLVAAISLRESSSLCLTSLELAMELNSPSKNEVLEAREEVVQKLNRAGYKPRFARNNPKCCI
jgi:hypothetical protein